MNYSKIYADFITSRRERESEIVGYSEKHHIIPRALGGGNEKSNLIRLIPLDHIRAHILLAKIHGGSMWVAVFRMTRASSRHVVSKKELHEIAFARKMHGITCRGDKHPMWGIPCSELAKQKTKARHAAGFNPMNTQEARDKVSAALRGRVRTAEHSRRISESKLGITDSDETRTRKKLARTGLKQSAEHNLAISKSLTGVKKSAKHVANMIAAITGRKLSKEHAEKNRIHLNIIRGSAFTGYSHTDATKKRMSDVNHAKKEYALRFGVSPKYVSITMMHDAGIEI